MLELIDNNNILPMDCLNYMKAFLSNKCLYTLSMVSKYGQSKFKEEIAHRNINLNKNYTYLYSINEKFRNKIDHILSIRNMKIGLNYSLNEIVDIGFFDNNVIDILRFQYDQIVFFKFSSLLTSIQDIDLSHNNLTSLVPNKNLYNLVEY